MSPTEGPGGGVYIRGQGAGPPQVDAGRVLRVALAAGLLVVVAVLVATTVGAARQDSDQGRLQRSGVEVAVTVTGCEGVSSGIGQAIVYYQCHGTFGLDGQRYDDVIGGNRVAHPVGAVLRGVTVPGHPGLLSTTTVARERYSAWTPFVTPLILGVLAAALAIVLVAVRRRNRPVSPGDP